MRPALCASATKARPSNTQAQSICCPASAPSSERWRQVREPGCRSRGWQASQGVSDENPCAMVRPRAWRPSAKDGFNGKVDTSISIEICTRYRTRGYPSEIILLIVARQLSWRWRPVSSQPPAHQLIHQRTGHSGKRRPLKAVPLALRDSICNPITPSGC